MARQFTHIMILAAAALLSACGGNRLSVEQAGRTAVLATEIGAQTGAILSEARARREEAFHNLVASDPSCDPVTPLYIFVPTGPPVIPEDGEPAVTPPLCAPSATASWTSDTDPPVLYRSRDLEFPLITDLAVEPTVKLAAAVAAYGGALADIAETPEVDITGDIDTALGLANDALTLAEGLGASGAAEIVVLSGEQRQTATTLVNFLLQLRQEARQVEKIKELVRRDGAAVEEALASLGRQIELWNGIVARGYAGMSATALRRAYGGLKRTSDFGERKAFLALIADAEGAKARADIASGRFRTALADMSVSHVELKQIVFDAPTVEQRRRIAQINRGRLRQGLTLIGKAVASWKGI
ncbi:MAG: hypothetical protein WA979_06200 [Pacificimonas sp.]